jgi:hypothetical protein
VSVPRPPEAVKLVISFLFGEEKDFGEALSDVEREYGPVDFVSESLPFNFTDYYGPEMGRGLSRRVTSFRPLISPGQLLGVKLGTNSMEGKYLNPQGGRKVNIDPGYLAASKFILATGKDYCHRIYLGDGIFGDLTLIFQKGGFSPLPWTYPDYASQPLIGLLNLLRKRYLWQVKKEGAEEPQVQGVRKSYD